jgi:hypothetical protein
MTSNSASLTDAYNSLRSACGTAKRGRSASRNRLASYARLLLLLVLAASVFVWPLSALVAFVVLQAPANPWAPLAYLIIALLILHLPLCAWARQKVGAAGSSLTPRGKLHVILPPSINALLLVTSLVYLGTVCSWRFVCMAV